MKLLDRLLFEQGGDCFFCRQPLAKSEASVEHLLAQANGGTSAEENVVACCKTINTLLSNKALKEKFAIVLRQKKGFQCPANLAPAEVAQPSAEPKPLNSQLPSKKLTQQKPTTEQANPPAKKTSALAAISSAGILALAKPAPVVTQPSSLPRAVPCPTCHSKVPSAVGQIDYVCPKCRGAFRY